MCQTSDSIEEYLIKDDYAKLTAKCRKCPTSPTIVARQKDPFCASCFTSYFEHKFRSTFGKHKIIKKGESVLIAYSGGRGSTVLNHLLRQSLSKNERGLSLLNLHPIFIYIEEFGLPNLEKARLSLNCDSVRYVENEICNIKDSIPDIYFTSLDSIFSHDRPIKLFQSVSALNSHLNSGAPSLKAFQNFCQKLPRKYPFTSTLLQIIRRHILITCAKQLKLDKILLGDCTTSIAPRSLTSLITGAGLQMYYDAAFVQNIRGVALLKPLKDATYKEIVYYIHLRSLNPLINPSSILHCESDLLVGVNSVQTLASNFLTNLERDFPSLANAVCRIGDKIAINSKQEGGSMRTTCHICGELYASQSQNAFLSLTSTQTPPSPDPNANPGHFPKICYKCSTVFQDLVIKMPIMSLPENWSALPAQNSELR